MRRCQIFFLHAATSTSSSTSAACVQEENLATSHFLNQGRHQQWQKQGSHADGERGAISTSTSTSNDFLGSSTMSTTSSSLLSPHDLYGHHHQILNSASLLLPLRNTSTTTGRPHLSAAAASASSPSPGGLLDDTKTSKSFSGGNPPRGSNIVLAPALHSSKCDVRSSLSSYNNNAVRDATRGILGGKLLTEEPGSKIRQNDNTNADGLLQEENKVARPPPLPSDEINHPSPSSTNNSCRANFDVRGGGTIGASDKKLTRDDDYGGDDDTSNSYSSDEETSKSIDLKEIIEGEDSSDKNEQGERNMIRAGNNINEKQY